MAWPSLEHACRRCHDTLRGKPPLSMAIHWDAPLLNSGKRRFTGIPYEKQKKVVLLVVAVTGHGNVPSYAAYLVDNSCVHLSSLCSSQPTFADMLPRLKPFSDKTWQLGSPMLS